MDVVIPCYNSSRFLATAIDSIRGQSVACGRIIVVDDCSQDNSADVARRAGCVVISMPVNSGPGKARNIGVRTAQSEFVAFLDADDSWTPDHLAELEAAARLSPTVSVAFTRSRRSDGVLNVGSIMPTERAVLDLRIALLEENIVAQSGAAVRRSAFLEAGGYREDVRYAEDYDLWLRMSRRGHFGASPAITVNYRLHPGQASRAYRKLVGSAWEARLRHLEWLRAHGTEEEQKAADRVVALAYRMDLDGAWYWKSRDTFDAMLSLGTTVPGCAEISTLARRKALLWWPSTVAQKIATILSPINRFYRSRKRRP